MGKNSLFNKWCCAGGRTLYRLSYRRSLLNVPLSPMFWGVGVGKNALVLGKLDSHKNEIGPLSKIIHKNQFKMD